MTENTITQPEILAPGVWGCRPGYTEDTFTHTTRAGDEDLTVVFGHDTVTAVPTLSMNGTAAVRVVINGQDLPNPTADQRADLVDELKHLETTVDGGSTDDELEALNAALDSALRMLGMTRD